MTALAASPHGSWVENEIGAVDRQTTALLAEDFLDLRAECPQSFGLSRPRTPLPRRGAIPNACCSPSNSGSDCSDLASTSAARSYGSSTLLPPTLLVVAAASLDDDGHARGCCRVQLGHNVVRDPS